MQPSQRMVDLEGDWAMKRQWTLMATALAGLTILLGGCASAPLVEMDQASLAKLIESGNAAMQQKDYAAAMRDYRAAADAGDASAMDSVGWLY
jgi:TPR repeat protein